MAVVAVDEHRADAQRACPGHVGVHVVSDVDRLIGCHASLLEGVLEDAAVRLLEADARAGGHEIELAHQIEGMQQLGQVPHPVAHRPKDQAALADGVQGVVGIGEHVPVAGEHEQLVQPAEELGGHRSDPQLGDGCLVDEDRALKAGLLRRLERLTETPAPVVVGRAQGAIELRNADLDPELAEGYGVHVLPRGIGTHDRVTDVQEDRAQRPIARLAHRGKPTAAPRLGRPTRDQAAVAPSRPRMP